MNQRKLRNIALFVAILLFIVGWTVLLYFYSPEEVIDWLGVTNSYLVIFFISIVGAIASVAPFSTYPALYTMAAGGVSPFGIVPLAAIGLTIGDLIFVYFGISAREAFPEKFEKFFTRLLRWLINKPTLFIQVFVFVWCGCSPLANNLITAPLAITGFPVKKLIPPLTLGNMMFPIFAAFLGYYGIEFLWNEA